MRHWWDARFELIGNEKMPLLIIDNFFPQPDILIKDAKNKTFNANAPYYLGIRAAVPRVYFKPLQAGLSDALVNIFRYTKGIEVQESYYSLTTTLGKDLKMVQRIPHVDGGNDMKIALLHYLCGSEHGGTTFYKQSRTGFETVSNARFKAFNTAVHEDQDIFGKSAAEYYSGQNKRFERIYNIEAKFNRAVIYFGLCLHSIECSNEALLTSDPSRGRLTVNTFMNPV